MINSNMRSYDFYTIGDLDEYGQQRISTEKQGSIKMSISISSQRVQDNILYKGCEFIGLTHDKNVTDKYVIQYGDMRLKVLYINASGRFTQVFMARVS